MEISTVGIVVTDSSIVLLFAAKSFVVSFDASVVGVFPLQIELIQKGLLILDVISVEQSPFIN